MRHLTLNHPPPILIHLSYDWVGFDQGSVRWAYGTKEIDGDLCNWPVVREARWNPLYWWTWLRVWFHGSATLKQVDPFTKERFVATFATDDEHRDARRG